MATKKPRITITLEPAFYQTLSRMAFLQGRSMSGVVSELLMAAHEPLTRTVALIEAAQAAPDDVKRGLLDTVEQLERDLESVAGVATVRLDELFDGFERELDPHIVTRGSGLAGSSKNNGLEHRAKKIKGV